LNVEAWKNQIESQDSDADLPETVPIRPRPTKGTRLVHSPPLSRRSSRTTSSAQTSRSGRSTPARHSEDLTASPKTPPQHMPTIPSEPGNKTPTGSLDEAAEHIPRKMPSVASLNGDRSTSPVSPRTPGMAGTTTTDDSDTDFQSAYSRNSRGSSGSLESRSSRRWSSDGEVDSNASATLLAPPSVDAGSLKRSVSEFPNAGRVRLSSTGTAVFTQAQPSPTFSVATVVRGRK
jgi:hypothetical protein